MRGADDETPCFKGDGAVEPDEKVSRRAFYDPLD